MKREGLDPLGAILSIDEPDDDAKEEAALTYTPPELVWIESSYTSDAMRAMSLNIVIPPALVVIRVPPPIINPFDVRLGRVFRCLNTR